MTTRIPRTGLRICAMAAVLLAASPVFPQNVGSVERTAAGALQAVETAEALLRDGKFSAAIPFAAQAVDIRTAVLGADHVDTLQSMDLLGRAHNLSGEFAKAEAIHARTAAGRERTLGHEHPDTAGSLANWGVATRNLGQYERAAQLMRRALAIREKVLGPEARETAISLNGIAYVHILSGEFDKAQPLLARALEIREKTLGTYHTDTANTYNMLGGMYYEMGTYSRAEFYWQRALEVRQKLLVPEHPDIASSINNLAGLYEDIGDYEHAEDFCTRSLQLREASLGPRHHDTLQSLINLAIVYLHTGAYDRAQPLLDRYLTTIEETLGPDHPSVTIALTSLGDLSMATNDYRKAQDFFRRALAVQQKSLSENHPDVGVTLNRLAASHAYSGDFEQAERLHKRALSILENAYETGNAETASAAIGIGDLYLQTGRFSEAEANFDRAVVVNRNVFGAEHPKTTPALVGLASAKWSLGDATQALRLLQDAQSARERGFERFLTSGSETRKRAFIQAAADSGRYVSFSLDSKQPAAVELGFNAVLQQKGRVLDAVSGSVERLRQSVAPADQKLFDQLSDVANQLSALVYQNAEQRPKDYHAKMSALAKQQELLETKLSQRSGEFKKQTTPPTLANIQRAIPPGATLLEWFLYSPWNPKKPTAIGQQADLHYAVYLVKRGAAPAVIDVGDAQSIDSAVRQFRLALADPESTDVQLLAAKLSDAIFRPLEKHLQSTNHLLVSADGVLNLVPLDALLNKDGMQLIRRFEITYLTSARDLLRFDRHGNSTSPTFVGSPSFGNLTASTIAPTLRSERSADMDRGGLVFRPLPYAALEAQDLKRLLNLSNANVLLGDNATEENVKRLNGPRILHIATHGFFLDDRSQSAKYNENPLLRSGLALAGANARRSGTSNDGILTALETAQLNLSGTQLVVLSACDTGVGDIANGEGVYGLRRALVLAGAQSQIASLWKVSDETTRQLMSGFYERLMAGQGVSAALRQAKLVLLRTPGYEHPYYWASFVSIGDWSPLTTIH